MGCPGPKDREKKCCKRLHLDDREDIRQFPLKKGLTVNFVKVLCWPFKIKEGREGVTAKFACDNQKRKGGDELAREMTGNLHRGASMREGYATDMM